MVLAPSRFLDAALEEEYKRSRAVQLAKKDMRWSVFSPLLWAWDCFRFLGSHVGSVLKATVWLAAVGLKPVYVHQIVGHEFHVQYRAWIITFTKVVFAMHPPGECLHLATLSHLPPPKSPAAALWVLAEGLRLPYIWVTGLGCSDFLFNIPVQLALVGRALKDNHAQCSTAYFKNPQVQTMLRGVAYSIMGPLSSLLRLVAGTTGRIEAVLPSFPTQLDPCLVVGSWAGVCLGFLLPIGIAIMLEHRARARFAAAHTARLSETEREYWGERQVGVVAWVGVGLAMGYGCLLLWMATLSFF